MSEDEIHRLKERLLAGCLDSAAAAALFAALPAVQPGDILGDWRGLELATGHPMDGMLKSYGWQGKRFAGLDEVYPLVFRSPILGTLSLAPRPMFAGLRLPRAIVRSVAMAAAFKSLMVMLASRKPKARLRLTHFLGQTTATMIYDELPINDAFVRFDATTLLGAMERKGDPQPYFFLLKAA